MCSDDQLLEPVKLSSEDVSSYSRGNGTAVAVEVNLSRYVCDLSAFTCSLGPAEGDARTLSSLGLSIYRDFTIV